MSSPLVINPTQDKYATTTQLKYVRSLIGTGGGGSQGPPGVTGPTGPVTIITAMAVTGATGPIGPTGTSTSGTTGSTGHVGPTGSIGPTGPANTGTVVTYQLTPATGDATQTNYITFPQNMGGGFTFNNVNPTGGYALGGSQWTNGANIIVSSNTGGQVPIIFQCIPGGGPYVGNNNPSSPFVLCANPMAELLTIYQTVNGNHLIGYSDGSFGFGGTVFTFGNPTFVNFGNQINLPTAGGTIALTNQLPIAKISGTIDGSGITTIYSTAGLSGSGFVVTLSNAGTFIGNFNISCTVAALTTGNVGWQGPAGGSNSGSVANCNLVNSSASSAVMTASGSMSIVTATAGQVLTFVFSSCSYSSSFGSAFYIEQIA